MSSFFITFAVLFFIIGFIVRATELQALKIASKIRYPHNYNADFMIYFGIGTWFIIGAVVLELLPIR